MCLAPCCGRYGCDPHLLIAFGEKAEARIDQLERERNSGGESVAGQTAVEARIGRLEESATGALQEQLAKTTRARDQAEVSF